MNRDVMSEMTALFRKPTSARQAAERLNITKQAVLQRLKIMRAFGAEFEVISKRIASRGPEAKLLRMKKEPKL